MGPLASHQRRRRDENPGAGERPPREAEGAEQAGAEEAPDYVKVERPEGQGRRANLRAYLGTVPDYSQGDAVGVKLSGATKGGPADKAGIQGGDVVVDVAGKAVKNIYDYTYVLESLKVGEMVKITVLRKGKRITLEVTPGSRQ